MGSAASPINYYTKTLRFQDINYQLAQNDDKTAIFEGWCDFLNYFDNSIHLQFSFLNLTASKEVFEQSILIPDRRTATMRSGMSMRTCCKPSRPRAITA